MVSQEKDVLRRGLVILEIQPYRGILGCVVRHPIKFRVQDGGCCCLFTSTECTVAYIRETRYPYQMCIYAPDGSRTKESERTGRLDLQSICVVS